MTPSRSNALEHYVYRDLRDNGAATPTQLFVALGASSTRDVKLALYNLEADGCVERCGRTRLDEQLWAVVDE